MARPIPDPGPMLAVMIALGAGACAPEPVTAPVDEAAATVACASAVAEHVGKPVGAVAATWSGVSSAGVATVTVSDAAGAGGERVHLCEIDREGRVRAILHPGA